jgi:hypothetical protein
MHTFSPIMHIISDQIWALQIGSDN